MKLNIVYKKEKNRLKRLSQTVVLSYAMVVIMTGIRILNQGKANLSQGIQK